MFYELNFQEKERFKNMLSGLTAELESLKSTKENNASKKRILANRIKHLEECKTSLELCINEADEDMYDFFMPELFHLVWGCFSEEEKEGLDPQEHPLIFDEVFDRVQRDLKNMPSLKELAQSVIKDRADALILSHPKMLQRLEHYDEKGVPRKISVRQAKLALLNAGLLDDIEAMVAKSERAVQISWEYATEFERNNLLILTFQSQMQMSDEALDELFKTAKKL